MLSVSVRSYCILILKCMFQVAHRNLIHLCYNKGVEIYFLVLLFFEIEYFILSCFFLFWCAEDVDAQNVLKRIWLQLLRLLTEFLFQGWDQHKLWMKIDFLWEVVFLHWEWAMANPILECDLSLGVCVTVRKPFWTWSVCYFHAEYLCVILLIFKCKCQVDYRILIDLWYNKVEDNVFSKNIFLTCRISF